jgi:hypothetical protein
MNYLKLQGEMMVSPAAYAHFIHMINSLADGRVCAVLEVWIRKFSLSIARKTFMNLILD